MNIHSLIKIARFDHWIKNIFVLPGVIIFFVINGLSLNLHLIINMLLGLLSVGFAASANYTINEWLDRDFDKVHPVKRYREGAKGNLNEKYVFSLYFFFIIVSLFIAHLVSYNLFLVISILLLMGVIYNVKPIRSKDVAYLDVLTESINNPLRFAVGWFSVASNEVIPMTILLAYWMGGAFLMAVKRFSEYRLIGDSKIAATYRKSFGYYTEVKLISSAFFYSNLSSFFLGIFLMKYRLEYVLLFPFLSLLYSRYILLAYKEGSSAITPETLYREKDIVVLSFTILIVFLFTSSYDLPILAMFR